MISQLEAGIATIRKEMSEARVNRRRQYQVGREW